MTHQWDTIFDYRDGQLFWINPTSNRVKAGDRAGYGKTYMYVKYQGVEYAIHRLVHEMYKGSIPEGFVVDHIDGDPTNNRVENLRAVSRHINSHNLSKERAKGYHKQGSKYVAQIGVNRKYYTLGRFDNPESARQAYLKAKKEMITEEVMYE